MVQTPLIVKCDSGIKKKAGYTTVSGPVFHFSWLLLTRPIKSILTAKNDICLRAIITCAAKYIGIDFTLTGRRNQQA